jgi:hypothetical protein
MKTEIVLVTPKTAKQWMDKVDPAKQRNLNPRTVTQYATAMRLGHWILTHQGIAFDDAGNLCDGQHRVAAIVESGVSVKMMVTTGMDEKQGELFTFDAIDRGSLRGIGQQLQVRHGVTNANRMSGAARTIALLCTRSSEKMTVATTLAVLEKYGAQIRRVLNAIIRPQALAGGGAAGTMAFCLKAVPSLSTFVDRVGDGDGVKKGDPAYALREYLLTNTGNGGLFGGREKACALCAMHEVLGNKVVLIKQTMAGIDFFADKQPRIVDEIAAMF